MTDFQELGTLPWPAMPSDSPTDSEYSIGSLAWPGFRDTAGYA